MRERSETLSSTPVGERGFEFQIYKEYEYRLSAIAGSFVALAKKDSEGGSVEYKK